MRHLFPGWIPPDEETLERYWQEATFALDTSVLLDLYRFSEEARDGLLKALHSFGDRLWVPHQVALEFHRNRFGVLLDQREAEDKLLLELDQIQKELDAQLAKRLRGAGRRDLDPLREAIDGGFEGLREKLQAAEKAHTKGLGHSMQEDPVYDEVVALCGDRIGPPCDADRRAEVIKDAEDRFRSKTPPGYLDADKEGDARFGDVLIWHQLCDKASETERPIVLIADDQKTDWVWEARGKTLGPRPELVAEMREKADVGFHLYTPGRLLQLWGERSEGREVGAEVLDEIEGSVLDSEAAPALEANLRSWFAQRITGEPEGPRFSSNPETLSHAGAGEIPLRVSPRVRSRVLGDSVLLSLLYVRVESEGLIPGLKVTVTDPDGESFSTVAFPMGAGAAEVPHSVAVRYPEHFPGAPPLRIGRYLVAWSKFTTHSESAGVRETTVEFVRDSFLVNPDVSP